MIRTNIRALALGIAAASALAAGDAAAAVTFTSTAPPDSAPVAPETLVVDFDNAPAAGYAITGGEIHITPLVPGIAAPPVGDTTYYLSVLGGTSATLTTPLLSSLSVYLGSLDTYNTITFEGPNGFSQSFTGSQLVAPMGPPPNADGNQFADYTNRRFNFVFDPETPVNKVIFASTGNSFEFDNIGAAALQSVIDQGAVPEPATWAMMLTGFFGLGAALRGSRRRAALAA